MKSINNRIDYSGSKVYVGIDVHKKKYVITARCERERVLKLTHKALEDYRYQQILLLLLLSRLCRSKEKQSSIRLLTGLKDEAG